MLEGDTFHYVLRLFSKAPVFSRESDSIIANVRLSVSPSVCLSVCLSVTKTPQPLRFAPINHQAYQPLSLSTIDPSDHQAYRHRAY